VLFTATLFFLGIGFVLAARRTLLLCSSLPSFLPTSLSPQSRDWKNSASPGVGDRNYLSAASDGSQSSAFWWPADRAQSAKLSESLPGLMDRPTPDKFLGQIRQLSAKNRQPASLEFCDAAAHSELPGNRRDDLAVLLSTSVYGLRNRAAGLGIVFSCPSCQSFSTRLAAAPGDAAFAGAIALATRISG